MSKRLNARLDCLGVYLLVLVMITKADCPTSVVNRVTERGNIGQTVDYILFRHNSRMDEAHLIYEDKHPSRTIHVMPTPVFILLGEELALYVFIDGMPCQICDAALAQCLDGLLGLCI